MDKIEAMIILPERIYPSSFFLIAKKSYPALIKGHFHQMWTLLSQHICFSVIPTVASLSLSVKWIITTDKQISCSTSCL